MDARWLSTLLLTSVSVAVAAEAAADEAFLGGGTHFYGGTQVERPLRLPPGNERRILRWRLAVNRTVVAQGETAVDLSDPRVRLDVPDVKRVVEARLILLPEDGDAWGVPVTLYPKETELAAAFGTELVGWVGEVGPLRVAGEELAVRRVALAGPAAVRRFRGTLVVVPPSTAVDDLLAAALVDRAGRGATVVALGVNDAPWVAADAPDTAGTRPLGAADGNHAEWTPDRVRALYPGTGQLLLVQLDLLDVLDDEPRAALRLAGLLRRIRKGPPPLAAPRSLAATPRVAEIVAVLFGPLQGDGPAVVVAPEGDLEAAAAKVLPPVVVLGDGGSLFLSGTDRREGPGLDAGMGPARATFLRFLTEAGLRVMTDRYWR